MDIVVTVPRERWAAWLAEGDLPGEPAQFASHFFIPSGNLPDTTPGQRVYIVAHGLLRGYAPLVRIEKRCPLSGLRSACLLREGGAEAVTIPVAITGFRGWRYRWWERADEVLFPDWQNPHATLVGEPAQLRLGGV